MGRTELLHRRRPGVFGAAPVASGLSAQGGPRTLSRRPLQVAFRRGEGCGQASILALVRRRRLGELGVAVRSLGGVAGVAARLRHECRSGSGPRLAGRLAGLRLGGARRVLVGRNAGQRRGLCGRGRQRRLLLRQHGLLAGALRGWLFPHRRLQECHPGRSWCSIRRVLPRCRRCGPTRSWGARKTR